MDHEIVVIECRYTRSAKDSVYAQESRWVDDFAFSQIPCGNSFVLETRLYVEPELIETNSPDELAKMLGFKEHDILSVDFTQ